LFVIGLMRNPALLTVIRKLNLKCVYKSIVNTNKQITL